MSRRCLFVTSSGGSEANLDDGKQKRKLSGQSSKVVENP